MSVFIIDHDDTSTHLIKSRLEALDISATSAQNKAEAQATLVSRPDVDILFVDPAPLLQPRQLLIQLRKLIPSYVYTILMGPDATLATAKAAGANNVLSKPIDSKAVSDVIDAARTMLDLRAHLNDPREDFPSGGGVIAKSAFAQLFSVSLDRADRYGEQTFILFIRLLNFNQISVHESEYAAQVASATLAKVVSVFHRQSDILSQTGKSEYALLLYRPTGDTEPTDAALRFADMLSHNEQLQSATRIGIELEVDLVEIPSGRRIVTHPLMIRPKA